MLGWSNAVAQYSFSSTMLNRGLQQSGKRFQFAQPMKQENQYKKINHLIKAYARDVIRRENHHFLMTATSEK
jgi:hypothetical protein